MSNFNTKYKRFNATKRYKCEGDTFDKDIAPHFKKQCFCEAVPRKAPMVCAKEGGKCRSCKGVIFYGVRKINDTISTLTEMLEKNYRYKENISSDTVKCTSSNFGGDPNRGLQK